MQRIRPCLIVFSAALAVAGCATAVSGGAQMVTIETDPPGASCVLRRDGQVLGVVDPTPGVIDLKKSHVPVRITCSHPGFAEATGVLGTHFQPAILGNVILGGAVGLIADASSGAGSEYDKPVTIVLTPLAGAAGRVSRISP